ncbi:ComEA family DNA-binding protein [Stenotrophomonas rhizophila]
MKLLWTIGCVYVARHAGASDGIAGRHRFRATRSSKVGPWFSCKALVLGLLLMGAAQASDRIDINTADASTLQQGLANVGPHKADAIVAYRRQHGHFLRVEDLTRVKGIGTATVERNRQRMTTGIMKSPAAEPPRRALPAAVPRR